MIQRPRLLIIDDDQIFQKRIAALLGKDFFILTARDGKEGLERALGHCPDVVILDIEMPVWGGIWTLKAFREQEKLRFVPILIISSGSHRDVVMQAKSLGADDYLIKSDVLQGLVQARLVALLERKKQREFNIRPAIATEPCPADAADVTPVTPEAKFEEICQNFADGF
jgi:CheY-like chemotaxis protein